ncbi:MAG: hypothetical protein F6K28_36470 [Microcoleus sp. SIO2G3]|nr:hypothetical protein [Microcoleus sp. SIO2G3]
MIADLILALLLISTQPITIALGDIAEGRVVTLVGEVSRPVLVRFASEGHLTGTSWRRF